MSRRGAFDPSRLDAELDELLAPPVATPPAPGTELPAPEEHAAEDRSAPRGDGGRPRQGQPAASGAAIVAVRVPKPLYDAVVHNLLGPLLERPSYAQIVGWTCEDHPGEVRAELERSTQNARRAPRGRRLATEAVPLTLRFSSNELAALENIMQGVEETHDHRITRTAAVIAALRVAVKHGLS
jgi:hypothetical protein